jgi:hypothetical protein
MNRDPFIYKYHLSEFKRTLKNELIRQMEFYLKVDNLKAYQNLYDLNIELSKLIEEIENKIDLLDEIQNKRLIKV